MSTDPYVLLPAVCVAAFGCFGYAPGFWVAPGAMLAGPALAVAIAVVNSVGNLGGFVGPYSIGALKDATGGFTTGLWVTTAIMLGSAALAAVAVGRTARRPTTLAPVPNHTLEGGAT